MYVCICNAITDSEILEAQQNGYTTLKQISQQLGVGNCCGRCVETAKEVLNQGADAVQKYVPQMNNHLATANI